MSEPLHVAIVDDHPLFREGVAHILSAQPDIEVVAEGESTADAIRIAAESMPDIMLLDVSMPGDGLNAVREIATSYPVISLVMLTVSEEEDVVTAALRAGARAYVLKGVAARELVRILRSVAAGEVYVTPSLAASLLFELTGGQDRSAAESAGGADRARAPDSGARGGRRQQQRDRGAAPPQREDGQASHDEHLAEVAGPQSGRGGADGAGGRVAESVNLLARGVRERE